MIQEVSGDILHTQTAAIAHGIAPNDDFKQGLALSLRENWPAMYKDFRHYCHDYRPKPGGLWTWAGAGSVMVINLFTQEGAYDHGSRPGKASLQHLGHCLKALKQEVTDKNLQSLALPRLATGVGGLKWDEVKPLIEQHLGGLSIPVIVYSEFHAGQKAEEKLAA